MESFCFKCQSCSKQSCDMGTVTSPWLGTRKKRSYWLTYVKIPFVLHASLCRNKHVCVREWELLRLCRCICVCAFYYCSHRVAYTALFPPVVILCFTCLILNAITHSIRLLPRESVCLSVSQPECLVLFSFCFFSPVYERQWTCLMRWCITRTNRLHRGNRHFTCVCVCVRGHAGVCLLSVSSEQSGFNDFGTCSSI